MERRFIVDLARFHRREKGKYVLQGYFEGNSIAGSRMEAYLGKEKLAVEVTHREGLIVRRKYLAMGQEYEGIDREYDLWITLPEGYEEKQNVRLRVYQNLDGRRRCVFSRRVKRLLQQKKEPDHALMTMRTDVQTVTIGGWAVGNSPCRIQVLDHSGLKLRSSIHWFYRQDIVEMYPEIERPGDSTALSYGFEVTFDRPERSRVSLIIAADGQKKTFRINLDKGQSALHSAEQSLHARLGWYYRRYGLTKSIHHIGDRIGQKLTGASSEEYMTWRRMSLPGREELRAQQRNVFLYQPLISIVVPLFHPSMPYLRELIMSVQHQTYANWQLILADGSGERSAGGGRVDNLIRGERRIRLINSNQPLGISDNTNAALDAAEGEYIFFADQDDLLPAFSLYEIVRRFNEESNVDFLYGDEDQVSADGKEFFTPRFKPDLDLDLLRSQNYIGHPVVVSRTLLMCVGRLERDYDGVQDYEFILRCIEKAEKICHIPRVLYHRRYHPGDETMPQEIIEERWQQGLAALQRHYDRMQLRAEASKGAFPGLYRTVYRLPDVLPRVSVIIPNRDHAEDLQRCVGSILEKSSYPNLEFVIVENNSILEETFTLYDQLQQSVPNLHVVRWEGPFNYADINNYALNTATGEYLLFLNNDTVMIGETTIEELLGPCLREDVGVVGGRLYYGDNTIQHAGVIIGAGGSVDHAFRGVPRSSRGYGDRIVCQSDVSAVTGACMMVKRSLFEELGGFDGTLQITYSDIDFCLRVRERGKLVFYNPYAQLYHFEGRTRLRESSPELTSRLSGEADEFLKRWPELMKHGDPYYNPNLSLDSADFSLKKR